MKDKDVGNIIMALILSCAVIVCVIFIHGRRTAFDKKMNSIGLHSTETKNIYTDENGNLYHCVPATGYTAEKIERIK